MKKAELFFAFLLVPLDIVMIILAFATAYYFRTGLEVAPAFYNPGFTEYLQDLFYLLPIWIGLMALNGLYSIRSNYGYLHDLYRIFIASSIAILLLIVFIFFSKSLFFSRIIIISMWAISILFIFFGRIVLKAIRRILAKKYGIGQVRVLIIGEGEMVEKISDEIHSEDNNIRKIIGIMGDVHGNELGLKNLGSLDNLNSVLRRNSIDEVIMTTHFAGSKMIDLVQTCADQKVNFKYIPDTFSLMTSSFQPALLGTLPTMELKPLPLDGWGRIIKRFMDILFSSILLIVLSPFSLLIAFLIKATSKGPVLFARERVGRDERPFIFYKFRSMYLDKCDYKGEVWTTQEDEKTRITPVGRILRKTNLDELPQLWNILIGDMSFIGPRPEFPQLVHKFEAQIPDYFRRHRAKAGLTGWAQVNGLKGDTSVSERVRYDIYYIENWSLWFDFKIILKTIGLVTNETFSGKSEYRDRP